MTNVLVVDDEPNLVELVQGYLERAGYAVDTATDGESALEAARAAHPDLVVLDLMLPGMDGIEVCRRLRQFSNAYILMLTARAEEVDKLVGLAVGADGYMTKPFSPRELVARTQAMLRRPRDSAGAPSQHTGPLALRSGDLVIDVERHDVTLRGQLVDLTAREFALLAALAAHPGRVFTRSQLLEQIWGTAFYDERVVDAHMANLRKKLDDDAAQPHYLETVRGVGYRFGPRAN
jgi:two-component system, OmpR family, alkaline phosphatase synthesis response regulator PhoP